MQIPMVVKERRVRVHASIPVSQVDALKALAAASGVSLSRAIHYAVERLLDVAREDGALAVTGALAPAAEVEGRDGAIAEVAEALDLRVPDSAPGSPDPVGGGGEPLLLGPGEPGGAGQVVQSEAHGSDRESDLALEHESAHGAEQVAAPLAAPADDAARAAAG